MVVVTAVNSQNLALNKPVYVSSVEPPGTNAKHFVNDGNYSTYWASEYQDGEWIYIDLEQKYILDEMHIYWENIAYAKKYNILYSSNAVDWTTYRIETNGGGGTEKFNFQRISSKWRKTIRYIKILFEERASVYGSAIYEIEIFGEPFSDYLPNEPRTTDGIANDQNGNTFEWIKYGEQAWAIENAAVETYRDGTPIPEVPDYTEWSNLTTGAWCYVDNDPEKGKLYNWYAVMGIHDNDENTPNKEFAPDGWGVPSRDDWGELLEYLNINSYRYDNNRKPIVSPYNDTTTYSGAYNGAARAMAADTTDWNDSCSNFTPGGSHSYPNIQLNCSGFNAKPGPWRGANGGWYNPIGGLASSFVSTTIDGLNPNEKRAFGIKINANNVDVSLSQFIEHNDATQVRFVKYLSNSMATTNNVKSNHTIIYPNPTTSIVTLQGDKEYDIEVYTLQGKKVMSHIGNTIDMSHLSSATYIVKALDKVENEEVSYKVVKN